MNQLVRMQGFREATPTDFALAGSDADFIARPRPLVILGKSGTMPVHTHKAIVRMVGETPTQVGIVGADFELVQHPDYFGAIEKTLRENIRPDLQRNPQVRTRSSHDGAWVQREYVFPAFVEALEKSSSLKALFGYRVVAWNALDGSSAAGLLSGLIDGWCSNGMVYGSLVGKQLRRHTSGFSMEAFREQIRAGLTAAQEEIRWLERLADTPLDLDKAGKFLKAKFSDRMADRLMEQVQREVPVRGQNAFALLSALTFYASHADGAFPTRNTGADHWAKTLHGREMEVQDVIRSQGFRELLAA